jgi:hypothetical protein
MRPNPLICLRTYWSPPGAGRTFSELCCAPRRRPLLDSCLLLMHELRRGCTSTRASRTKSYLSFSSFVVRGGGISNWS